MNRRLSRTLDLATGLLLLVATGLLVHERLLPAWRARALVEIGERVPAGLRYRTVGAGAPVPVTHGTPSVHLVFQSTCSACAQNLPAWKRLLRATGPWVRAYAVGLEEEAPALRYAGEHLGTALVVRPADTPEYTRLLRVRAVPSTLLLDREGRLAFRRVGLLTPADVDSLARLARRAALAGDGRRRPVTGTAPVPPPASPEPWR